MFLIIMNWIISIVVFFLVVLIFDFSIIGWILGLVASFLFEEFIGPLFIDVVFSLAKGNENIRESKSQSSQNDLLKNFNLENSSDYNYSVYYHHKNNSLLKSDDIKIKVFIVQYKNDPYKLGFRIFYNSKNRSNITDIEFNSISYKYFDKESIINFTINEGYNSESYLFMTLEKRHYEKLDIPNGKVTVHFRNGEKIIFSKGLIYEAVKEAYYLGLQLNKQL